MTGAVTISVEFFSINKRAILLPTLSRVTCLKILAPCPSSEIDTIDCPVCPSTPGDALVILSPVRITSFLTKIPVPKRSGKISEFTGI